MNKVKRKINKHKKNMEKVVFTLISLLMFVIVIIPIFAIVVNMPVSYSAEPKEIVSTEKITNEIVTDYSSATDEYSYLIKNAIFNDLTNDKLNTDLASVLNPEYINPFTEKLVELLYLKYPMFIVSELLKENIVIEYSFYKEFLLIKFTNHIYEENEFDLRIYYNEIKDFHNLDVDITLEYQNENGFEYDPKKKTVAITFDDGPSSKYTLDVINTLSINKARATFYMLGLSIENNYDIVKAVYDSGNEIGNHGYTHTNFERMEYDEINKEIADTNEMIYSITGEYATQVRPPYGSYSQDIKENINYQFVLWSVDTDDWKTKNTDKIVNHVFEYVEDGAIILMHDIFSASNEALKIILPELYLRGYQVVDVTTLATLKGASLENNKSYRSFE